MLEFITTSLVIVLGAISPGPDFVIVTRNTLRFSQKIGTITGFGIACSNLLHASYCILGITILIAKSPLLFNSIKYIGAAYLIYLGIKGLIEKPMRSTISVDKTKDKISIIQAFLQGMYCNALNPKAIIFFLALFTMLIKPSTSIFAQVAYGFEIFLIAFIWFAIVAAFFSHKIIKNFLGHFMYYLSKIFGCALIAFGLKISMLGQN